jgi:iron complex transport system substrate-binding protein
LTRSPNSGDTHLVRGPVFCRRRLLSGAAASFLSVPLGGCRRSSSSSPRTRARIVSLSPSTTETLFAVGAGPLVVGRSRFCDYPPEATKLPAVGGFVDVSLEATLGLAPTLVVGARGPGGRAIVDALEARGIATYFPQTETVREIEEMILGVGERAQRAAEANALVASMATERRALSAAVAAAPRRRVLLLFGLSPIVGAGPLGFPHEMLTMSGCDNVLAHGEGRQTAYPTLSFEQVLAADPDVIVLTSAMGGGAETKLPTPWQACRAVQAGHVVYLPGDEVLRPGPRIALGQRRLIQAVHPTITLPSPTETTR